ncbi:MAG: hypothetical protein IPP53_11365 [Bacteroidetes bacterium]|nr:hypothetical protein [Bacteroidota bacterium]
MKNIISFILLTIIYNSSLSGKNLNNWIQSNYFDSINTQITIDSFGYNFIIENVTQDTLYIFSSYIDDKIIKTDDLKRISKRNDTLIISFLPLIPFVFTSKSDNLILNPSVFDKHQIVYEFKMVLPNSKIKLVLPKEILIPETQNSKLYCNFNEQKIITERKLLKAKKSAIIMLIEHIIIRLDSLV